MAEPLPDKVTIGQKYDPAMAVANQAEADAMFERLVEHTMRFGKTRAEAEALERANLGYYAGYYDNEARERVERLFACAHPVFGSIAEKGAPTVEEAFRAGVDAATAPQQQDTDDDVSAPCSWCMGDPETTSCACHDDGQEVRGEVPHGH